MADAGWYYSRGGQQYGPVSEEQLREMIAGGQVGPTDFIWREGMADWAAVQVMPELMRAVPAGAAALPYAVPTLDYHHDTAQLNYAGFWARLGACILDGIILRVAEGALGLAALGLSEVFSWLPNMEAALSMLEIIIGWLYFALMESSSRRATLGKMAMGISVTDMNGQQLSFGRATGRHFAKFISAVILLIGFIMAAFTERKQALHDMIAGTLVVSKYRLGSYKRTRPAQTAGV